MAALNCACAVGRTGCRNHYFLMNRRRLEHHVLDMCFKRISVETLRGDLLESIAGNNNVKAALGVISDSVASVCARYSGRDDLSFGDERDGRACYHSTERISNAPFHNGCVEK